MKRSSFAILILLLAACPAPTLAQQAVPAQSAQELRAQAARQAAEESAEEQPAPAANAQGEPQRRGIPDDLPWWYELPLKTRQELPEINMTLYFYDSDKEKRFVKINGERYAEGDKIDGPLRVRQIRREAVVLQFRRDLFLYRGRQ